MLVRQIFFKENILIKNYEVCLILVFLYIGLSAFFCVA